MKKRNEIVYMYIIHNEINFNRNSHVLFYLKKNISTTIKNWQEYNYVM